MPRVERRTFLALGVAAMGLAGCTRESSEQGPPTAAGRPIAPADHTPMVRAEPKVGRNEPCPCGSGKKYKHCHGTLAQAE